MADVIEWVRGDSGTREVTLSGASGPANLTGATVKLLVRRSPTDLVDIPCSIVTPLEGIVSYSYTATHSATTGYFKAELEVTFGGGSVQTFPEKSPLYVKIRDDLNP